MTHTLTLAHLYPDHMNIYGDRGNLITLARRCHWRGMTLQVQPITVGDTVDWGTFDLAFFGGGQDSGQALIAHDFLHRQGEGVARAIEDGLVMLAICGGTTSSPTRASGCRAWGCWMSTPSVGKSG